MLLETTVAGVNSSLQRARAAVDSLVPAASAVAAAPSQRELLAEYVDAWEREDIDGIVALLREDAVRWQDQRPPDATRRGRAGARCGGSSWSQLARGALIAPV